MALDQSLIEYTVKSLDLNPVQIINALHLLIEEQCTIPFIARYRKEKTGGMDEVQIQNVQEAYETFAEREKRRVYILDAIEKMEKMTPKLKAEILAAQTLNQLEDIYAPYKSKRKTKATLAKEAGLEELSNKILDGSDSLATLKNTYESKVINPEHKIKTWDDAVAGACDIIIETFAHDTEIKEKLRGLYWDKSVVKSEKAKKAEEIEDFQKYRDYFEFSQSVADIKTSKNSYRFLAIRRGVTQKVLKMDIVLDETYAQQLFLDKFVKGKTLGCQEIIEKCIDRAYKNYIHSSLELELKTELKKLSDEAAIGVFGVNLKNLLLQPYLGPKSVMGVDPGIRTGCKIAIVDETGKFIVDTVIYPHGHKSDIQKSAQIIDAMIEQFKVSHLAVGNGTFGRETLHFLEQAVPAIKNKKAHATLISEAGASIYSASEIARKEFPDKDPTVRGAISIARRFQDPLAELVKIDPKSIGVGQYQHDVNQTKLKKSLGTVVENCVNYVGVDLNTASPSLLSYVSGIGAQLAEKVVEFRQKIGGFKNRKQLLEVPRFSEKVYQQSAGFLRIYNGENPLDATFIHPESYPALEQWAKKKNKEINELVKDRDVIDMFATDRQTKEELGGFTHDDIIKSLKAPTQDPRTEFKSFSFRDDIKEITDLKIDQWYPGVVTNITQFGAFVDIGIKENGLLHISQIADKFVEDPLSELQLGQHVQARVLDVDLERKRVSLSLKKTDKSDSVGPTSYASSGPRKSSSSKKHSPQKEMKNNAFAALKNLKL